MYNTVKTKKSLRAYLSINNKEQEANLYKEK